MAYGDKLDLAQSFIKELLLDLKEIKPNLFKIAFRLDEAVHRGFVDILGYGSIYELADAEFGIGKTSCKNYLAVCKRYMTGMYVSCEYEAYSFTQLVEMLPMSCSEIRCITSSSSIGQIRAWKQDHRYVTLADGRVFMYKDLSADERREYEASKGVRGGQLTDRDRSSEIDGEVECRAGINEPIVTGPKTVISGKVIERSTNNLQLANKSEREKWLNSYRDWGVWLDVPELELTCYKYIFTNGDELVVSESFSFNEWSKKKCLSIRYHLKTTECPFLDMAGIAKTYVLEYLTTNRSTI